MTDFVYNADYVYNVVRWELDDKTGGRKGTVIGQYYTEEEAGAHYSKLGCPDNVSIERDYIR